MPETITETGAVSHKTWRQLITAVYAFDHARCKPGTTIYPSHWIHEHEDHGRLVITNSHLHSSIIEGGTLHGYRLEPTKDHQDLINLRPAELEQVREENGRFHGTLIRIAKEPGYYVLIGPPITFTYSREDSDEPAPTPQSIRYALVGGPPKGG